MKLVLQQNRVAEEGLLTGSLLAYVRFTDLVASTSRVEDEDAPAVAKVQRVLRAVIRETRDCEVVRKCKVGGDGCMESQLLVN